VNNFSTKQVLNIIFLFNLLILFESCNAPQTKNIDHPIYFNKVYRFTDSLGFENKVDKANQVIDLAYKNFKNPGTEDIWRKYHFKANYYRKHKNDLKKARLYIDSMAFILKGNERAYPKQYSKTLFEKADYFIASNDFNSAFESYDLAREFLLANMETCEIGELSYRMGEIRYKQNNFQDAINYLKKSVKEGSACNEKENFYGKVIRSQSKLNTIGLSFEKMDMPDSAIHYYQGALKIIEKNEKEYPNEKRSIQNAKAIIYGNLGGAYYKKGDNRKAESLLRENIRINGPQGFNDTDALTGMFKLTDLMLSESRVDEAGKLMDSFNTEIKRASDDLKLRWLEQKWKYFDKVKDIENAYAYSTHYFKLKDTLFKRSALFRQVDIDSQRQIREQKHNLDDLNKKNQLKNFYLIASFLFLVMASVILLIILNNSRRRGKMITELRDLNAQMTEKNASLQVSMGLLEKSQKENSKMMKVVAHDLRNPIGNIQSLADLLLSNEDIKGEEREMVEMIMKSSTGSLELIYDLLHSNTNKTELQKEPVDLLTVLSYCIDMLAASAKEKNQVIILEAEHIIADVNREKMWRVVSNLISNAIKFSPENSEIQVCLSRADSKILIAIKDKGIGIPDEMKDLIFNISANSGRSGTSGEQSFGLGLAISRQIVEAHGGRIWFESNQNKGTTFYVEL